MELSWQQQGFLQRSMSCRTLISTSARARWQDISTPSCCSVKKFGIQAGEVARNSSPCDGLLSPYRHEDADKQEYIPARACLRVSIFPVSSLFKNAPKCNGRLLAAPVWGALRRASIRRNGRKQTSAQRLIKHTARRFAKERRRGAR